MKNKVLVILSSCSPNGSISSKAAMVFLDEYKKNNPQDEIVILDLNTNKKVLNVLNSKNFSTFFNAESDAFIEQFKSSNKIIIAASMINFNIPTALKSYLDNILQPKKTFDYKYLAKGKNIGLVNNEIKVQLILAQGSEINQYPFALFDEYLEGTLNFMGLTKIDKIIFAGTKTQSDYLNSETYRQNMEKILKSAKSF
ncbi:MAG: FMN-dependent NADH-azoreductase [Metamycoplasmataceae bacterium]